VTQKPVAGLPTQVVNDKGRYRQLRARWQSPELFQPQPPSKYPKSGKLCANEPRPHGIRSPSRRGTGIVDVNVHHRSLSGLTSPFEYNVQLPISPFLANFRMADDPRT
jgi:hypothetical protein